MILKAKDIKAGEKCPICKEVFRDEEGNFKKPTNVFSRELKAFCHDGCYMPYFQEDLLKILYKVRCYSMGDTITTTAALRELKRIYPKAKIAVWTYYPDIFAHNPHIELILDMNSEVPSQMIADYIYQVDSFDTDKVGHFGVHSVDFSSFCALNRQMHQKDWEYEVNYGDEDKAKMLEVVKANGIDVETDQLILINPHGTEWPTRDWGPVHFQELANWLRETYPWMKLVSIGGKRSEVPSQEMKNYTHIEGAVDLYGKFSLLQSLALMDMPCSKLMITPDTGTLHLAACARELPIVGIFTLIKAFVRTPVRNGELGYKFIGVEPKNDCNCTYDGRFLTDSHNFQTCPRLRFLENTLRSNLPKEVKLEGLKNHEPKVDWKPDGMMKQITDAAKKYRGPSLPCFPQVRKVSIAVLEAMSRWVGLWCARCHQRRPEAGCGSLCSHCAPPPPF